MPLARASELDRVLACGGSLVLPRSDTRSQRAKTAADWGTYVHTWKETGVVVDDDQGQNRAFARRLRSKLKASGFKREVVWPREGRHEVTLAFNVVTREVKTPPPRQDAVSGQARVAYIEAWKAAWGDEWVTGTLDYAMEIADFPWVDDLKTGRFAHPKDYEAQQAFYALAWSIHKYGDILPTRSTITHWPIYPRDGKPVRRGGVFDVAFLKGFHAKLLDLRDRVRHARGGGLLRLFAGDQCQYCPSSSVCPKLVKEEEYVKV